MANPVPVHIPLCGTPNAPKFNGKTPSEHLRYQEDIELLGNAAIITIEQKIKAALRYAVLDEAEVWQTLPEATAVPADWDAFVTAVKQMYPGCEATDRYSRGDVQYLVQDYQRRNMHNQDELGEYTRAFRKISAVLLANGKLADTERNILYLDRFPRVLQQKIHECLLIVKQDVHPGDPYSMNDVVTLALLRSYIICHTRESNSQPHYDNSHYRSLHSLS